MMNGETLDNRRILVIDDNLSIHEDFRKILSLPQNSNALDQARSALFGEVPTLPTQVRYEVEFAGQGREALGLVQAAQQQGRPYAVAFVDMLMPPGWDGLETIEHLWYADPEIQIVVCTAYSDHPWEDVGRRIGDSDKLLILMKPFNSVEVVQLANALTKKWNLARTVQRQMDSLAFSVNQRTAELQEATLHQHGDSLGRNGEVTPGESQDEGAVRFRQREEYLAIMSDEIFTPMNELLNTVGMLSEGPLTPEQKQHAVTIQKCGQDLLSLLKDMQQFMGGQGQATRTSVRPSVTAGTTSTSAERGK